MSARRRRRTAPLDEPFDAWVRRELPPELPERAQQVGEAAVRDALPLIGGLEFVTYACAARVPPDVAAIGGRIEGVFRRAVRHAMTERLAREWPDRRLDGDEPDVLVEALPDATPAARLEVHKVFVAGRYCKLERGLSQTPFHCRECRGRGRRAGVACERCRGSGRVVPESVADFVTPPIQRALGGGETLFHGAGREDVDVLMLGRGRPFVVSVERPLRRTFDAAAVAREVADASGGRVTVSGLRRVGREERRRLTSEHGAKEYRARVRPVGDEALPPDAAERLAPLAGAALEQRTPRRVDARRADRVRRRRVRELAVEEASATEVVLRLRTDPGTYVKELVSGDDGRTTPSVAGLLGVPCTCSELDVLGVADQDSGASSGSA